MNKNLPFVFLPTNKYSRLIYLEGIKEYLFLVNDKLDIFEQGESYAFAYVLGDIKPDELGVWAYCPFHLGGQVFISKGKGFICDACRKIIATNDFKLNACISSNPKEQFVPVSQISDSSLAILVGLKNKGINEVDVEYDEILGKPYMAKGRGIEISPSEFLPKLKEGSIIIVKDKFDVPDTTDKELIGMINGVRITLGEGFVKKVLGRYENEEISFGKMVELFNEQIQPNAGGFSLQQVINMHKAYKLYCENWKGDEQPFFEWVKDFVPSENAGGFTLDDMKKAIRYGFDFGFCSNSINNKKNTLQSEEQFIQSLTKEQPKGEFSEKEIRDLKLIRNYFGEHDKTTFEHFAFEFIDGIIKKIENKK